MIKPGSKIAWTPSTRKIPVIGTVRRITGNEARVAAIVRLSDLTEVT